MLKFAQETFTEHNRTIESSITRGEEQLAKTAERLRGTSLLHRKSRLLGLWLTCFLCSWFLYYMFFFRTLLRVEGGVVRS